MISTDMQGTVCVVRFLNNFTLDDVHEVIEDVESSHAQGAILDMEQMDVLTSSAIGLLIALFNNLSEIKIKVGVSCLNENNRHLFALSKLDTLFSLFDTVEEGIDSVE